VTLLDQVCEALDAAGVRCALIGAAALAAAGVARSTYDVDLLVTDPRSLGDSLWADLRARGASVEIRRGDADDPLLGVVHVSSTAERPVDVIVGRFDWQRRAIERAARPSGGPAVVRPGDLVLLKLHAGGTQDLWDIAQLLALPSGAALAPTVEEDLHVLPADARERWAIVRRA
jgi:hypothetical protein